MHAGYRRPGPIYRWQNWWGVMLIHAEEDDDELLRAEDEAIAAQSQPEQTPADLAALTELMRDGREPQDLDEAANRREG